MADLSEYLYLGFNRRVCALKKETGRLVWNWTATHGQGHLALLVEDDTVFVSISGFTYALEAATGREKWFNPLKGMGYGIPMLATAQRSVSSVETAENALNQSP